MGKIFAHPVTNWLDWSIEPDESFWGLIESLIPFSDMDWDELEEELYKNRNTLKGFTTYSEKYIDEKLSAKLSFLREKGVIGHIQNGKNDCELLLLIAIFSTAEKTGINLQEIKEMIINDRVKMQSYVSIVNSSDLSEIVKDFLTIIGERLSEMN